MFEFLKRSSRSEHRFCQENLSPFLDGQLTARERKRVEHHLRECASCRADLQALRHTVEILHAMPRVRPPRSFLIPASEGVRQRQAQRNRLAYGYLRLATGVATALLVLVISGDALLHFAVGQPLFVQNAPAPEMAAADKGLPAAAAEPTPVAETLLVAAPESSAPSADQSAGATAAAAPLRAAAEPAAAETATEEAVAETRALTVEAVPSQTFARAAGAPPLPTATGEAADTFGAASLQATATAILAPTEVPSTPTPMPTRTPVPPAPGPVATVAVPSPQPVAIDIERSERPLSQPTLPWAWLVALQPLVPWLEGILAGVVTLLLAATLWLRRKQRVV